MNQKIKLLVIAGPTASGKTALAIQAAKRFNGEIVSADSMQIYQYMNIGTAKPDAAEQEGVRHTMLDEINPRDSFSVADYCTRARQYIADMAARGKLPIVAGGTGLYISSLIDNIQFAEGAPDLAYRERLKQIAAEKGNAYLHAMLTEVDPIAAAKTHPNNSKRVIRALECFHDTGVTKTQQDEQSRRQPSPYQPLMTALTADREALYRRINDRVDGMMARGLLAEVEGLRAMGFTRQDTAMQGIGYKELLMHLEGEISLAEAVELIKQRSRNYAKRQLTWFRRDDRYIWFDALSDGVYERFLQTVEQFLQQQ